jgi:hypothetical protein
MCVRIMSKLVYQPVPPHGLEITNNYNYLYHALIHLLHILIIVIGLVSNNFSLSITPPYVFDLYLIEHYILSYEQQKIWYSYLSLIHEYMSIWLHTLWEVFFI